MDSSHLRVPAARSVRRCRANRQPGWRDEFIVRQCEFKIGYAANAMPVRLGHRARSMVHRAAKLQPLADSSPQNAAIVYWARAVGQARSGSPKSAASDLAKLKECQEKLKAAGNNYWATQVGVLDQEARAWIANATGDRAGAIALLRAAADQEDARREAPGHSRAYCSCARTTGRDPAGCRAAGRCPARVSGRVTSGASASWRAHWRGARTRAIALSLKPRRLR